MALIPVAFSEEAGAIVRVDNGTPVEIHHVSHENAGDDEVSVSGLSGLLADGQTPLSHDTTHENGGSDEVSVTGLSGLLADAQTPLGHHVSHEAGGTDVIPIVPTFPLQSPDTKISIDLTNELGSIRFQSGNYQAAIKVIPGGAGADAQVQMLFYDVGLAIFQLLTLDKVGLKMQLNGVNLYTGGVPTPQGPHLSGGGITAAAIYAQLEAMGIFAAS